MNALDITRKNDSTEAVAVVGIERGLYTTPAAKIVKYIQSCGRKVSLSNAANTTADGGCIFEILTLEGYCGERIIVRVDGVDEQAERIVRNVCELISFWEG